MEIKLYKSPWRAFRLILLCSIFVGAGIFLLTLTNSPRWVAWMNILFFALGYPVGLFHLFDRRPQIIINKIGIFDRMAYNDFINWEVIRSAYLADIHGQKLICLIVDEKFEPKIKINRRVKEFNKQVGVQELNIALGQINVDEKRLLEFILTMISVSPEQREPHLKTRLIM